MSVEGGTPIEPAPEVAGLFPDNRVEVRRVIAHGGHRASLLPEELEATSGMAPARFDEFASARAAARAALAALAPVVAIPRGPQRQPVWPDGVTGTITHTRGHCLAAVALRSATPSHGRVESGSAGSGRVESGRVESGSAGSGADLSEMPDFVIGLDAEERDRVSARVARRILVPAELTRIEQVAGAAERQGLVAATFGLKEAFYKAHHQLDPRYLGFDVVQVHVHPSGAASFASTGAELAVDPASEVAGRVIEIDGRMIAAVWIQRQVRSAPRR